jgi:hypothetical protein
MLTVEFVYCNTLFDNSIYLLEIECENCFKIFCNDVDPMYLELAAH